MTSSAATLPMDVSAPPFVTITDVTPAGVVEREYVISNEATGRYFLANQVTVQFFEALRQSGSVGGALAQAAIEPGHAKVLIQQLLDHGILTSPAKHTQSPTRFAHQWRAN